MVDLATTADLEVRLGRSLTASELTRAAEYLKDASALVRRYTRQDFTVVTNDVAILRPEGAYLVLPQLPVTAVHSVSGVNEDGSVGEQLSGWQFDGINRIDITTVGFRWFGDPWWPWPFGPESFAVDHDHGDNEVPDDVVGIVCGMVLRVLTAPSLVEGMSAERVGQYSYQMSQQVGGGSPGLTVRLSEQDKHGLSVYRRKAGSVQVRL